MTAQALETQQAAAAGNQSGASPTAVPTRQVVPATETAIPPVVTPTLSAPPVAWTPARPTDVVPGKLPNTGYGPNGSGGAADLISWLAMGSLLVLALRRRRRSDRARVSAPQTPPPPID